MNSESKELIKVYKAFPKSFVSRENEMIIYRGTNTFFLLDNVNSELELDCKILEYCSFQAINASYWQAKYYHFDGICDYFKREFTKEEMKLIYFKLGNGVNRQLCIKFIQSGFDIGILKQHK